ncbi:MAG TPA: ATP-binding protein [Kofleriaceae bacterium]|nr:ATP-binding protein [Kofleriaceae bacterium]
MKSKKEQSKSEQRSESKAGTTKALPVDKMIIDTIERQRQYVEKQKTNAKGLGVVFADAFLRGMRDLGYKDPAWALSEQLDNSLQAGADTVAIRFGYTSTSKAKPDMIAVCDNGNGMIPEMISFAVRWGGTDREGDRSGFGRYGYGLPSSAVSIAKRYTVFAKAPKREWHAVTVDIEQLAAHAGDLEKTQELLTARKTPLPTWVVSGRAGDDTLALEKLDSGVVIVLEEMDRLSKLNGWIKTEAISTKLLQHFGVIYRRFIPEKKIYVNGQLVQAVDPLFLLEHARFFDETPVHAEPVETRVIEAEGVSGAKGKVRIRASLLPPNFQWADPNDYRPDMRGIKSNNRLSIMRKYNGLIVCRAGRQLDCISPDWTKFQNYDVNIKIEIDFDPTLDEFFSITTAKQQVVIDDQMWEMLRNSGKNGGGLEKLILDLRERRREIDTHLKAKAENKTKDEAPRPSTLAMEATEKFKGRTRELTPKQQQDAQRNLEQAAAQKAELTGEHPEKVLAALTESTSKKRWEVEFLAVPEGPFYRPKRLGEQRRIIINTEHPFYSKIYLPASDAKHALEVMLFVLAERELDSVGEAEIFYKSERQRWSDRLRHALDVLITEESLQDKASAFAEVLHASGA